MKFERDIGARGEDIFPEQFYRPYKPLSEELKQIVRLAFFRSGRSPRVASVKVNENCNFGCAHCNASQVKGTQMTTKEVFNVQRNLKVGGIQMEDVTGGEPLLRPDLPQIIENASSLGMVVTLNTNGGIKKDRLVEEYAYWYELAEAGLFGAYFSYDGMDQKSDPRVIHLAAFLVNTLHIYGGVRTVVTQNNLDKVYNIGERCMSNNVFFQAVPAVALGGESSASADDFKPLDDLGRQEFIGIIHRLTKVRGPFANFLRVQNAYLKQVIEPSESNVWHCEKPASHWLFIDAQGKARACNDRSLSEVFSFTGDQNPLFTKGFYRAVEEESKRCGGCSWHCNWEANRKQIVRAFTEFRLFATMGSLT